LATPVVTGNVSNGQGFDSRQYQGIIFLYKSSDWFWDPPILYLMDTVHYFMRVNRPGFEDSLSLKTDAYVKNESIYDYISPLCLQGVHSGKLSQST
jgi:hypothetical protein